MISKHSKIFPRRILPQSLLASLIGKRIDHCFSSPVLQAQRDRTRKKKAISLKKRVVNCSKSPSYTIAKIATPLRAGSEALSEPSTAAVTEIGAVEGECNARINTPLSLSLLLSLSQQQQWRP
jgi:hypothetical protein